MPDVLVYSELVSHSTRQNNRRVSRHLNFFIPTVSPSIFRPVSFERTAEAPLGGTDSLFTWRGDIRWL